MFSVTISEKGGQQRKQDFSKPEIIIGRVKGNDVVLPKSNVSKQHTKITLRDQTFFIVDLMSTNGTYVNGRKVTQEQPLSEDDKIYIGDFILQLQRVSQISPQPPQPPPGGPGPGGRQGRQFPTVMDGHQPRPGGPPTPPGASQSQPSQPQPQPFNQPRPTPPPQRNPSAAGDLPLNPPNPLQDLPSGSLTPVPDDDLRATIGDAEAPLKFAQVEPLDPEPAPSPSPRPGPGPSPSPFSGSSSSPSSPSPSPKPASPPRSPALSAPTPLKSDFDESFHRAQQDVARAFFEKVPAADLPLEYPLPPGPQKSQIEGAVAAAVQIVAPQVDRTLLKERFTRQAIGLGPVEDYLDDPAIQSIYVNAPDRIVLRRDGALSVAPYMFAHPDLLDVAARRLLGPQEAPPLSDEVRFSDGTRVHILMPPLAVDGPVLTIRKPHQSFPGLDELASSGAITSGMAEFLNRAVEAGRSILIAGPTSAGKTTMLAALVRHIAPSSRVIAVEEHSQLPLTEPSFIRLEANPSSGVDMRFLVQNSLGMHPERLLLDECRGAEAYDWVTATASGTNGSMMTLHGTSANDALGRLESMCLLGTTDISPRGLREQIARAVDLIIVLHGTTEGSFRVQQISELQGVDLDAFRINDIFYYRVEGTAGAFHPTGYIPLFYEDLRHAGLDVDLDIFRE